MQPLWEKASFPCRELGLGLLGAPQKHRYFGAVAWQSTTSLLLVEVLTRLGARMHPHLRRLGATVALQGASKNKAKQQEISGTPLGFSRPSGAPPVPRTYFVTVPHCSANQVVPKMFNVWRRMSCTLFDEAAQNAPGELPSRVSKSFEGHRYTISS